MSSLKRSVAFISAGAMSLFLAAGSANAVLVQTAVTDVSHTFYDGNVSTIDLINVGRPTLGSFVSSQAATFNTAGAHDGSVVHNSGLGYWGSATGGTVTLTYTLAGSVTGYDITSINTIHGWTDSRERHAAQRYDVLLTTVLNPAFTLLGTVTYDPYGSVDSNAGAASTQVTWTENATGVLASGVTGIRFVLRPDPGGNEVGVIREYDVFGRATVAPVPEPATATLGLLALGGLMARRRRTA